MKIFKKLFWVALLMLIIPAGTIIMVFLSLTKINKYGENARMSISALAKWNNLKFFTEEILIVKADHSDSFFIWKTNVQDFESFQNKINIENGNFLSEGKKQWNLIFLKISNISSFIESNEGRDLLGLLDKFHVSIIGFSVKQTKNPDEKKLIMSDQYLIGQFNDLLDSTAKIDKIWNNFADFNRKKAEILSGRIISSAIIYTLSIILIIICAALLLFRTISAPADRLFSVLEDIMNGNLAARFPLSKIACSSVKNCEKKDCRMYDNFDENCSYEFGSPAEIFGNGVSCPHIIAGEVKDCESCKVNKLRCKDDISTIGMRFNILMDHLENSAQKIKDFHKKTGQDLLIAGKLQRLVYPQKIPAMDDWDLAYYFKPKSEISCVFYNYYMENRNPSGLWLFSISGKGISSALVALLLDSLVNENFKQAHKNVLGKILQNINDSLADELGKTEYYGTGIMLRIKEERLEYVNADYNDIYYRDAAENSTGIIKYNDIDIKGPVLGMKIGESQNEYKTLSFEHEP